jgi:hypothetical protein
MKAAPLIYLFGYPGVGKNTVAREMERLSAGHESAALIAIQNHLISNAFRHVVARQRPEDYPALEPVVKHHTMKAWLNFLAFIDRAAPDRGLIFTSVLYQNDPDRVEFFDFIRAWAQDRRRPFFPVRLICAAEEALRRTQSPNRSPDFKLTDAATLQKIMAENMLLRPDDENFVDLDVTTIAAREAAALILEKVTA